jgi:hypothetical protein
MYKTTDGWVKDDTIDCLKDPEDILDYCRKVRSANAIKPEIIFNSIKRKRIRLQILHWHLR